MTPGTTLRDALADRLGGRLRYAPDGAFKAGTRARVGIVVVAEPPYAEGRGDSATLLLPPAELAVVARVRPLVDRLVVVVYSGRPMVLRGLAKADAIVAAWLPGTEAEGLAAVLLGDSPFRGTTPYAWPVTAADAPRTGKKPCDGAVVPGRATGSRPTARPSARRHVRASDRRDGDHLGMSRALRPGA